MRNEEVRIFLEDVEGMGEKIVRKELKLSRYVRRKLDEG